jgi:hypothetical protein
MRMIQVVLILRVSYVFINNNFNFPDSPYFNKTLEEIEMMKMQEKQAEEDKLLNSSVTDYEMFTNSGKILVYK